MSNGTRRLDVQFCRIGRIYSPGMPAQSVQPGPAMKTIEMPAGQAGLVPLWVPTCTPRLEGGGQKPGAVDQSLRQAYLEPVGVVGGEPHCGADEDCWQVNRP